MPIIVNLSATLLLGASLAAATRSSPAFKESFVNWVLVFLLAFVALVITPVATFALRFYPQWSMLYFFDPQIFPNLNQWLNPLSALAAISNFATATLGYGLTRAGYLSKTPTKYLTPFILSIGALLGVLILQFDQLIFVGDYDAYWEGKANLFIRTTPGILGSSAYLSACIFVLWIRTRFHGRDPKLI